MRPRWPRVSFWTRRRTSSTRWLASLHQMEGVGDLDRVGEHGVERQPPRTRQVQHGPADGVAPRVGPLIQPGTGAGGGAALDHIEQLAGFDVDDRGRPRLGPPAALPGEEHLIEPERGHRADAVGVLDQRGAIGDHGVVDGVPIRAELDGDLVDRATPPSDLFAGPSAGPIRHRHPATGDTIFVLEPRPHRTAPRWGSTSGACATPAGPGSRNRPDRPAPPPAGP